MAEAWKKEGKVWVVAVKSELKALQWVLGDNRLHAKDTIYLVCIGFPRDPWVMNTFVRAKALCQSAKKELQLTIHYTVRFEPRFGIEDLLNSEAKAVGADYLVSARSRRMCCFEFVEPRVDYDVISVKTKPRVKSSRIDSRPRKCHLKRVLGARVVFFGGWIHQRQESLCAHSSFGSYQSAFELQCMMPGPRSKGFVPLSSCWIDSSLPSMVLSLLGSDRATVCFIVISESSIWRTLTFSWLNPLMEAGSGKDDLFPLPGDLDLEVTGSVDSQYFLPKIVVLSGVDRISSYSWSKNFHALVPELLIAEPRLNFVGCCNELNAGYAADGYARAKGVGACVVTFTVGGQCHRGENLPVICVVGGPNSNDYGSNRVLHLESRILLRSSHASSKLLVLSMESLINGFDGFCVEDFCPAVVVKDLEDAHELIDYAIATALRGSKPVYISVSCNLAAAKYPSFGKDPVPYCIGERLRNQNSLHAAIDAAANFLNASAQPVLVAGPKLRVAKATVELANSCEYATAVMPSAGDTSTLHRDLLGSSIMVELKRVTIGGGLSFGCVLMNDFLHGLAAKVPLAKVGGEENSGARLRVNVFFKHIQGMLSKDTAVISETGGSWFNCQKLKLPDGCGYEFQMQYGAVGCSVGAVLGTDKVTAQDVGTMIRYGQRSIIFLINSSGYTIEVEIHDGAYNTIKNLDYTGVVNAFHNNDGKCWTAKVSTEALKTNV
ncbi:hypothetical protein SELMODRAFT_406669 [Selaginella moellendorffii]|uniref:pyruvate decarboxylase n=1 Tax=Selaginella moellendorffii TaxID=88036 RepID=D8R132_SELML|nr:hypothetical protein SELMODRAFT_406669 [Selaginella moellendorffii]